MKTTTLLPAILLFATLGLCGIACAHEGNDANNKDAPGKEWAHHDHDEIWELLPAEKRKLLHDAMEKVHKENAPLHAQKHKLYEELDALVKAPTFDADAYLKKSTELDALRNQMKKNKEAAFAAVAGNFTQEERKVLVVMHHMMKHHHEHHTEEGSRQS